MGLGERRITFYVYGTPIPQGSLTAHASRRKDGSLFAAVHYPSGSKLHKWRNAIGRAARAEWGDVETTYNAVEIHLDYYFKRPLTHYKTLDMVLKEGYSKYHHEYVPDLDKLVRATMDAIAGIVYHDDRQVIELSARKLYVPRYDFREGLAVDIHAVP